MARRSGRTQTCGDPQAHQRLAQAIRFLDVAELTADESDPSLEYSSTAASIAILAGTKDTAHYGFITVTASDLKRCLREAKRLVDFAERAVRG